ASVDIHRRHIAEPVPRLRMVHLEGVGPPRLPMQNHLADLAPTQRCAQCGHPLAEQRMHQCHDPTPLADYGWIAKARMIRLGAPYQPAARTLPNWPITRPHAASSILP